MSYSLDTNILIYASDESSPRHAVARKFLETCSEDSDLLCLTWSILIGYQRIATHPSIFKSPLSPDEAWGNVLGLLQFPRVRVIRESEDFAEDFSEVMSKLLVKGNLVPDAHLATILRQHGVRRIYTVDTDFRKFDFLEAINPFS
jgi:toxin-antitoxin system PIN domain toxin